MTFVYRLLVINESYDNIMEWEEVMVDADTLSPKGLNMIPGGFKGMRELYKLGYLSAERVMPDDRDAALVMYLRENPRKGIPNPFLAQMWEDDDFYNAVVFARSDTLRREQVIRIRNLAAQGVDPDEIVKLVDARNVRQVRDVISGKTYSRVT